MRATQKWEAKREQIVNAEKSKQQQRQVRFNGLLIISSVILLHLVAIVAINQLWTGTALVTKNVSGAKIQSYLYQVPQNVTEPKVTDQKVIEQVIKTDIELEVKSEVTVKPVVNPEIVAATSQEKELQEKVWQERETNNGSIKVSKTKDAITKGTITKQAMTKGTITKLTIKKASNTKGTIARSENSQYEKLNLIPTQNANSSSGQNSSQNLASSSSLFTQSYLAKQRASKLDELIIDKADQYTKKRSLSEMDGDMQELVFPQVDEYSKVLTTNHRLDPNRIVRQGDTCYRIVQVPTQINPFAENLGYPFNCGGDKIKKAINDAISAQLDKRMISKKG
ncbi:hypothetical protein [Shewanella sp. 125m-1]